MSGGQDTTGGQPDPTEDILTDIRMQQGEAGLLGIAKLLGAYRRQLLAEGVPEETIRDMLLALQSTYLVGPGSPRRTEEA